MQVAFYAPLKSPEHANPSGDRAIARALLSALRAGGYQPDLASSLRSRETTGKAALQDALLEQAAAEIRRLIQIAPSRGWKAWITYHNYWKAPDLIGPAVSRALGIPYVLIEATRARKRLIGPHARFAAAAEAACDAADAILHFTTRDAEALLRDAPPGQRIVHLAPFIDREALPTDGAHAGPMLTVAMMRPGDKLGSYRIIADTLTLLPGTGWQLDIAGDGLERAAVEAMMAPFDAQVRFLGRLDPDALTEHYADAQLFFWPGLNEAFGLVYLEAQAAGLPIVAQDRPGVREVLSGGPYPPPRDGPEALAERLQVLLNDPALRQREGEAARDFVARRHLRGSAAATLDSVLRELT